MCLALTLKMKTQLMDRTQAPAAVEIDRPNLPSVEKVVLNNNLEAYILNQGKQDVVLLELIIPVGRYQEPSSGLAFYLFKMLTEGTTKYTSEEIASKFDFFGSHLEITPTLDHVSIKLYTLSRFFEEVLDLFCHLLTESNYPEHEFDILKQIRVQQIKQQEAKNNVFASLKFREALYGADHPYGRKVSIKQAQGVSIQDVVAFKNAVLSKPTIFLTGRITDKELSTLTDKLSTINFSDSVKSESFVMTPSGSERIKKDGSTQASIRLGKLIINRKNPDIHNFKITNEILGGFFGSRLMKNIREEKGLTYGIHSSILHLQQSSYWSIGSEVLLDKVDLALEEIHKEIKTLQTERVSDQELNMVTNYMKGKFLTSFDSPFSSHNMIKSLVLDGLETSYYFNYFDAIQSVNAETILEVANKYLDKDSLTTVIVG